MTPEEKEVAQLITFLQHIPMTQAVDGGEFGYNNPVLVCMDAVLSMNRKYDSFVRPRIAAFRANYPDLNSLAALLAQIERDGQEAFCGMWNYKHAERVEILIALAEMYVTYAATHQTDDELTAMKHWAAHASISNYRQQVVPGIGLATFQYLRMLLGVSTVKPDVHIRRALREALGRNVSNIEAIALVEAASAQMGLSALHVDHNIWRYYSAK